MLYSFDRTKTPYAKVTLQTNDGNTGVEQCGSADQELGLAVKFLELASCLISGHNNVIRGPLDEIVDIIFKEHG